MKNNKIICTRYVFVFIYLMSIALSVFTGAAIAQDLNQNSNDETDNLLQYQATLKALNIFKKLPAIIIKTLGLTEQQVKQSTLGKSPIPLEVKVVWLTDLENFSEKKEAKSILRNPYRVVYPLYADDKLITTITLAKRSGKWELAVINEWRIPEEWKKLDLEQTVENPWIIVDIPAMHKVFLGQYKSFSSKEATLNREKDQNSELYLTIIPGYELNDTRKLCDDQEFPAKEIFLELKKKVKDYEVILTPPEDTE